MLAGRAPLSGHFGANHLRRGVRREETHEEGDGVAAKTNSCSTATTAATSARIHVAPTTAEVTATAAAAAAATTESEEESRKRLRSSSMESTLSASADEGPHHTALVEDYYASFAPRPTRRLSACVQRNVFYPPPAELAVAESGAEAEVSSTRVAPSPGVVPERDVWAGAMSMSEEEPLELPPHLPTSAPHSSLPTPEKQREVLFPDSLMTCGGGGNGEGALSSSSASTTPSGTRFLSALEHQQLFSAPPTFTPALMNTSPNSTASQPPRPPKALTFSQDSSAAMDCPLLLNSPAATPPPSPRSPTAAAAAAAEAAKEECVRQTEEFVSKNNVFDAPAVNTNAAAETNKASVLNNAGPIPIISATAAEEEHVESDEALQREIAEDLRLSMDVAFTPSGSGNGAPPVLSQSSFLHDEEEEREEQRGACTPPAVAEAVGGVHAVASQHNCSAVTGNRDLSAPAMEGGGSSVTVDTCLPFSSPSWPLHEGPPPHLPMPFAGETCTRLPLAVVAASASVSASATGSRHRTVFSFSSRKAVDAVAVAAAGSAEEGGVASFSSAPAPPAESPQPAAVLSTTVPEAEGEGTILLPPAFLPPQLLIGEAQPPLPPPSTAAAPPPYEESSSARRDVAATVSADESGERSCPLPPSSPLRDTPLADILPPSVSSRSESRPPLSVSPQRSAGGEGDAVSPRHLFAPMALSASTAAASTARRGRTCFTLHSGLPTTGPSATVSAAREEGSNSSNSMSVPLPPAVTGETSVSVGPVLAPQLPLAASAMPSPSLPATSSTHEEPPAVVREAAVHSTAEAFLLVAESYAGSEWVGVDAAPATALSPPQTTVLQTEAAKTAVMPQSESMRATAAAAATTTAYSPVPSINIPYALPATAPGVEAQEQELLSPPPPELPRSTTTNTFYDLPPSMQEFYTKHRGVRRLYDWQHDLLTQPEVRAGRNFIYSLPTSGGKTLVAELSLLRCVVNRRKSGIFVLPFVSLAEEKTLALQPLTTAFDFAVDGHYGSSGRFPLCDAPAIYVCTIEKANSLLNYMLEEGRTCEIGAVVVDELHMLGESRRGATLELFLSKLLMIDSRRQEQRERAAAPNASSLHRSAIDAQTAAPNLAADAEYWPDDEACYFPEEDEMADAVKPPLTPPYVDPGPLQIIGMSATIPNLSTLARWLRAACFERDFRPVPLHAYSVVGGLVLRDGQTNERNLSGSSVAQHLLELATEVPEASVLIFCASRQQCVDTARGIVQYLKAQAIAGQQLPVIPGSISSSSASAPGFSVFGVPFAELGKGAASVASVPSQASAAIRSLLTDLEALSHHEASQLSEIVPHGVAFHHGGLLAEERELIEDAFRRKHVRILCSTSTLAAGVNLPARRVIIKTPYVGRDFLTKSRYLQMCGRAGRAGLDPYGESYLLLTRRDQSRGHALMRAGVEACQSQILEDDQTLTRSLLECIGVGLVTDSESARRWSASLLSCHAAGPVDAAWRQYLPPSSPAFPGLATAAAVCASASPSATTTGPAAVGVAAAVTEESENSRSVPLPISTAALDGVPLPALTAMTRASLNTLARCGLVTTCAASPPDAATENEEGESDKRKAGEEEKSDVDVQVRVTPFGSSSVRSCFSVEEALLLREELDELRHTGLILSDDLHLCYFLTPLREVGECDWEMLRLMMSRMSDSRQRIASLLGVDPYFIDQQAMGLGGPLQVTEEGRRRLFTAKRFYVALMLADVLAEVPMATVEQRYNVNRGQLQNLMRSASMFSSSITSFCHAMEWYSLEAVLSSFVKRLGFGVKPDLLPLMEIRGMQPPRARALWNAGFKKLAAIAAADADDMVAKVKSLNPVDSKSAKFFTKRSALMVIREAHLTLQSQIKEKKGELQELTVRRGVGQ